MPVTNFDYRGMSSLPDVASVLGLNNLNTINSLLDEDDYPLPSHRHSNSIDRSSLLLIDQPEDQFHSHIRRPTDSINGSNSNMAGPKQQNGGENGNPWTKFAPRHKGNKSLPMNTLRSSNAEDDLLPTHSRPNSIYDTPSRKNNRHSLEFAGSASGANSNRSSLHMSPPASTMPNLRLSLSNNDVPTLGSMAFNDLPNMGALSLNDTSTTVGANMSQAEQRLHNHNAALGRIPANVIGHRRESSIGDRRSLPNQTPTSGANANGSYLNNGAVPAPAATMYNAIVPSNMTPNGMSTATFPQVTGMMTPTSHHQYGMPQASATLMTGSGASQWGPGTAMQYGSYPFFYPQQQPYAPQRRHDSQHAIIMSRRARQHDGRSYCSFCLFVPTLLMVLQMYPGRIGF
jgi:hypothetical protein